MLLNQRLRHSSDNASVFVCCGVQLVCMCTRAHVSVCAYVYMYVVHGCAMCTVWYGSGGSDSMLILRYSVHFLCVPVWCGS